jgi:hypothetical protein
MTVATLLLTCLIFLIVGWTGPSYYVTALSIGAIVCIAASNGGTTSQDLKTGFLVGATPKLQQYAILVGALASALVLGPILLKLNENATVYVPPVTFQSTNKTIDAGTAAGLPSYSDPLQPPVAGDYRVLNNQPAEGKTTPPVASLDNGEYLVDRSGNVTYKVERNFPANLHPNQSELGPAEKLIGPQGVGDPKSYRVWHNQGTGAPVGRYLVNDQGVPVYLADPGINGIHKDRPDGSQVTKFDAPKATLMSYIIKGILNRQLPWGLVLLGVMIAIVLEMAGIPSLAFAVGVYLPLSSSSPIFIGGMVRWLVDLYLKKKFKNENLTEEELVAEGDKSGGVLMASGYIAGGAIAGIFIAYMAARLSDTTQALTKWSEENNPFFDGPHHAFADLLSLIPFLVLVIILYLTGREVFLRDKAARKVTVREERL